MGLCWGSSACCGPTRRQLACELSEDIEVGPHLMFLLPPPQWQHARYPTWSFWVTLVPQTPHGGPWHPVYRWVRQAFLALLDRALPHYPAALTWSTDAQQYVTRELSRALAAAVCDQPQHVAGPWSEGSVPLDREACRQAWLQRTARLPVPPVQMARRVVDCTLQFPVEHVHAVLRTWDDWSQAKPST